MPPDILGTTYQSRNVPLPFSATVSDADGGPISCSWAKKGPTASAFTHVSGPVACAGASGAARDRHLALTRSTRTRRAPGSSSSGWTTA